MDADLNAHEPTKPFVAGHDVLREERRRAARARHPSRRCARVRARERARDRGVRHARRRAATSTASRRGERAAARVLATHATRLGGAHHARAAGDDGRVLYLADNAAFGFALARLYEATHDPQLPRARRAHRRFLARDLATREGGGFFASTPDPNAVGVFAARRKPFEDNVMAVRFLATAARASLARQPTASAIGRALAAGRHAARRSRSEGACSATCSCGRRDARPPVGGRRERAAVRHGARGEVPNSWSTRCKLSMLGGLAMWALKPVALAFATSSSHA